MTPFRAELKVTSRGDGPPAITETIDRDDRDAAVAAGEQWVAGDPDTRSYAIRDLSDASAEETEDLADDTEGG